MQGDASAPRFGDDMSTIPYGASVGVDSSMEVCTDAEALQLAHP